MARTKGSGWGGGPILYQVCPHCKKKKAYYDWFNLIPPFKCTACKKRFDSDKLLRIKYAEQIKDQIDEVKDV